MHGAGKLGGSWKGIRVKQRFFLKGELSWCLNADGSEPVGRAATPWNSVASQGGVALGAASDPPRAQSEGHGQVCHGGWGSQGKSSVQKEARSRWVGV